MKAIEFEEVNIRLGEKQNVKPYQLFIIKESKVLHFASS